MTVNAPPTSGSNISATGAVEVIVTKTQTFSLGAVINSFMGVANNGFTMLSEHTALVGTEAAMRRALDRIQAGTIKREIAPAAA